MVPQVSQIPLTGVSAQTLAVLYHELALMLNAGIDLGSALEQAAASVPLSLRSSLLNIAAQVRNGNQLAPSMSHFRNQFNPAAIAMVAAADRTGDYVSTFRLLNAQCEKESALIRTVRSALTYPTLVVITAILVVFILSYTPLMDTTWAVRLLWFVGCAVAVWLLLRFRWLQHITRYVSMLLPWFGGIILTLSTARFCQTFGMLIRAGVPYLEALEATRPAVSHPLVSRAVDQVYFSVRNGNTVESAIRREPAFPPIVHNLVGAGEAAGSLDDSLLKAAEYLQADAEYKIANSAKAGGVIIFLMVAVIVGLIVITFFSNYWNLVMSFGEEY